MGSILRIYFLPHRVKLHAVPFKTVVRHDLQKPSDHNIDESAPVSSPFES